MKIDDKWTYVASFHAKLASEVKDGCGPKLTLQLVSDQKPDSVFVENSIKSECLSNKWQKFEVKLRPTRSAKDSRNAFAIKLVSTSKSDSVIHITLASLFPPTYKNRPNGVRIDLAEVNPPRLC